MKTITKNAALKTVFLAIALFSTIFACKKDASNAGTSKLKTQADASDNLNAPPGNPMPSYNLNVFLNPMTENSAASGFINFHQDPDPAKIITLDTRVSNLEPNHAYILERAVNPIADTTGCSSTAWLKLGLGLTPQAIHTDEHGNGEADLWRNVSAIPSGTAFHIHFQVIDSVSSAPVLTSDCYNYMVR
jgi:hypothetical protein